MGLLAKLFPARPPTKAAKSEQAKAKYRGVQISVDPMSCCNAVRNFEGQRFLSHEIPALPVEQCDADRCQCTYGLFNDRRTDVRRTGDLIYDVASDLHLDNHRSMDSAGRRSSD